MIYPFLYHDYFFKLMYHEKDWKKEYIIMKSLMLSVLIKFYIINSFAKRNQISFLANRI